MILTNRGMCPPIHWASGNHRFAIHKHTRTRLPHASESFVAKIENVLGRKLCKRNHGPRLERRWDALILANKGMCPSNFKEVGDYVGLLYSTISVIAKRVNESDRF